MDFSSWVTSGKLILGNMSPVNTDELDWVSNHRVGLVWPTQTPVGEASSKLKGHGLWRHSLRSDTRPHILSKWHAQQCAFFFVLHKQQRQCCRLRPYAAPMATYKSPVHPPWERLLGARRLAIFCLIFWDVMRVPTISLSWESKSDSASCSLVSPFDPMH